MSSLRITTSSNQNRFPLPSAGLTVLYDDPQLRIEADATVTVATLADGRLLVVTGWLVGVRNTDGTTAAGTAGLVAALNAGDTAALARLEGRCLAVLVSRPGECRIDADPFAQHDLYVRRTPHGWVFGTDLSLVRDDSSLGDFDQIALAHAVTVYGNRPAKRDTFYKDVQRLGVGEAVVIAAGTAVFQTQPFVAKATGQIGDSELNDYADRLLEAVRVRGSSDGNVVYLSSGWDSTALLACLAHLFGARSVRAVIGRMRYADRSGVINQFEIDRARAVAEFFGVPLEVVEFDYRTTGPEQFARVKPLFRSQQLASLTGLNHAILAEGVRRLYGTSSPVFAGEISDGAHNLGFSQFVTIMHPVLEFRQYSDKMASYLFGPTFLSSLWNGTFESDPIYQWLKARQGPGAFDGLAAGRIERTTQLLASFFLRARRFPLWSLDNDLMLNAAGRDAYRARMQATYLAGPASAATPETLYSWYLHLYNSFHWQGSTVTTLPLTAEAEGLRAAIPFWDSGMQDFLSTMPESGGRGLDLNPTKYPLKWMLTHRIKYPMHLQAGPHSYLYDVDPTFSHGAEVLYGSSFAPFLKSTLKRRRYRDVLSAEIFDLAYIDGCVNHYLAGDEVGGAERNDLMSLCLLSMVGWYGDE